MKSLSATDALLGSEQGRQLYQWVFVVSAMLAF